MADEQVTRMLTPDATENKETFIRILQSYPDSDIVIQYDPTLYPLIQGVVFDLVKFNPGVWGEANPGSQIEGAEVFYATPDIEHGNYFTKTMVVADDMFGRVNAFALFAECLRKFRALYLDNLYTL